MLARSVFIDVLGHTLIFLNASVGVIPPAHAGLVTLALMLIYRSTRTLVVTAGALPIVALPITIVGMTYLAGAPMLIDLFGGRRHPSRWLQHSSPEWPSLDSICVEVAHTSYRSPSEEYWRISAP